MTIDAIHIRKQGASQPLAGFRSMSDAIRWKSEHDLGIDFLIDDRRHPDSPEVAADRPLVIGMAIRDTLAQAWNAAQIDRLVAGEVSWIPKQLSAGLERETALFAALCLAEAGAAGWRAVEGDYHDPSLYPPVLRTHTLEPQPHSWLVHDSGAILDLTDRIFDRVPVTILHLEDDRHSAFTEVGEVRDLDIAGRAAGWIDALAPSIVPRLRYLGAARMMPPLVAGHDPVPEP